MLKRQIIRVRDRIKNWYQGECVPPPPNDPSSGLIFLRGDTYKKSSSAVLATVLVEFWSKHWQWTIGLIAATMLALMRVK